MSSRCSICPNEYRCVEGDGPTPNRLVFLGERPGGEEEKGGRPFIGRSGKEFNETYLGLAGLERDDIYITNTVKCFADQNRKPTATEVSICSSHHLPEELWRTQPSLIVAMGATANSLFPDIWLERDHGIMQYGELFGHTYPIFPTYHPASGLHDTSQMIPLLEDFRILRTIIESGYRSNAIIDPYADCAYYDVITDPDMVDAIFTSSDPYTGVGLDMETIQPAGTSKPQVWCTTFSVADGTGWMIQADNRDAARRLTKQLEHRLGILHHSLFARDIERMSEMGVYVPRFHDTAHICKQLGNQPQKLKALAYRQCGIKMKTYEDVVMPYSRAAVLEWLMEAWQIATSNPVRVYTGSDKRVIDYEYRPAKRGGKLVKYKVGEHIEHVEKVTEKNSLLFGAVKRIHTHTSKPIDQDAKTTYNPWEKWRELEEKQDKGWPEQLEMVSSKLGPMPQAGLDKVPMSEAIPYACLSGTSKIQTEVGLLEIGDIVNKKMNFKVLSYNNSNNSKELRHITKWIRNDEKKSVKWMSVSCEQTRRENHVTRYTPDHKLLTRRGWVEVQNLNTDDFIALPEFELNHTQKQVVYGSLLGDGTLSRRNENGWACLVVSHSQKQHGYLNWKRDIIGSLCQSEPTTDSVRRQIVIAGRRTTRMNIRTLHTVHHPELSVLYSDSYPDCRYKHIGSWVNKLDELALAVWYQDDGSILGTNQARTARFYTNSFHVQETQYIMDVLLDRFGLETTRFEVRKDQWAIGLSIRSAQAFFEMVSPFVHPCMEYKLPMAWRGKFIAEIEVDKPGLFFSRVTSVQPNPTLKRGCLNVSYCLEVDGNHNFFTQYELAHNCMDARATRESYYKLDKLSKKVGKNVYKGDYDR